MKYNSFLKLVFLFLFFSGCNGKGNSNTRIGVDTTRSPTDDGFGAVDDTTTPALETFKKIVRSPEPAQISNEFYTEKNFQGEKIVQTGGHGLANYELEEGIVIKSMKLLPGYQVSFDFGSECNAIENGHFRYYNTSMPDILATCGCDENFSKVREIYVRWAPDQLNNGIQVWEKPYLLGKGEHLMGPADSEDVKLYKWKDFGFPTAKSIQIPKGLLVNLYKDEYFQYLLVQINTSNGPIDKFYFLTKNSFTHADFKSLSIAKLK